MATDSRRICWSKDKILQLYLKHDRSLRAIEECFSRNRSLCHDKLMAVRREKYRRVINLLFIWQQIIDALCLYLWHDATLERNLRWKGVEDVKRLMLLRFEFSYCTFVSAVTHCGLAGTHFISAVTHFVFTVTNFDSTVTFYGLSVTQLLYCDTFA
jgi:hypothetical protein